MQQSPSPPLMPAATAPHPAAAAATHAAREQAWWVRWVRRMAWGVMWLGVAVIVLLALAYASMQLLILPKLDRFKGTIEERATRALGLPVKIGTLRATEGGFKPTVVVEKVAVHDATGREALTLERASATLAWRTALSLKPALDDLSITGLMLDVRRDRDGRILVAGVDMAKPRNADEPLASNKSGANWLLSQPRISVAGSSLRWTDERRGAPTLSLADVSMALRNSLTSHAFKLEATPPPTWGDRFTLEATFAQPLVNAGGLVESSDWKQWSGTVDARLPRVDVVELHRHVSLPFALNGGRGAIHATMKLNEGRLTAIDADVALQNVDARLAPELKPLDVTRLQTRIEARRPMSAKDVDDLTTIDLKRLSVTTGDGTTWPAADASVRLKGSPTEPVGGSLTASNIELELLAAIATRLPLAPHVRQRVTSMDPKGHAERFEASWQGSLEALQSWRMQGQLKRLALQPQRVSLAETIAQQQLGRPGVEGAAVAFDATQDGGQATVSVERGSVTFPGIFETPRVPVDRLASAITWQLERLPNAGAGAGAEAEPKLVVQTQSLQFANADAQGEVQGRWHTGAVQRFPGVLDLSGRLSRGQASAVARYLPLALGRDARAYVAHAIKQGAIEDGSVRVLGDLSAFPFRDARKGDFWLQAKGRGVRMQIVPGATVSVQGKAPASDAKVQPLWPELINIDGSIRFERTGMRFAGAHGEVMGVKLHGVAGDIADFEHEPTLKLTGTATGPLQGMLAYVAATPVGGWMGHALATTQASGEGALDLRLQVPIKHPEAARVRGDIKLQGNDVRMNPDTPWLMGARGSIVFTERDLQVHGAEATVFGGPARFEGGTRADGNLHFDGTGVMSAEGFAKADALGSVTRLARLMRGQTPYRLALSFNGPTPSFTMTSDLVGMAVDAPAPMGKPATTAMPLRVSTTLMPMATSPAATTAVATSATAASSKRVEDVLRIEVADVFAAQYRRLLPINANNTDGSSDPVVMAGVIGVGINAKRHTLPARGVVAMVDTPFVDADAWQRVAERLDLDSLASGGAHKPTAVASVIRDTLDDAGYAPTTVHVNTAVLRAEGRDFKQLTAKLERAPKDAPGTWRAVVDSAQAKGEVTWRPEREAMPAKVTARLDRMSLDESDEPVTSTGVAVGVNRYAELGATQGASDGTLVLTRRPPALDVVIDELVYKGKSLGRLEVDASHERGSTLVASGGVDPGLGAKRERRAATADGAADGAAGAATAHPAVVWHLNRLRLTAPDASLEGTGQWVVEPTMPTQASQRRMLIDFVLRSEDSGAALARLGWPGIIRKGAGVAEGQLSWLGSPLSPHLPTLAGKVSLHMDEGQFLKADTGAARLLGLLSLQSLPRRLLFDFRDLFSEGFSFDQVSGDITLASGIATTQNLRMRGVQANVLMAGRADVVNTTQQFDVWVMPEINAGAASLAYAVINPAVGLGTFLAQWLFRKPLTEATTRQFRVSGSWSEPIVEPVERKAGGPMPSTGEGESVTPSR